SAAGCGRAGNRRGPRAAWGASSSRHSLPRFCVARPWRYVAHMRPVAQRAAFVSAIIGPVLGALFLFAPIQGYCASTVTAFATPPAPGSTPGPATTGGPAVCGSEALWQRQAIFPMPFFAVLVWSLAPVLVYVGILMRLRGQRGAGTALVVT